MEEGGRARGVFEGCGERWEESWESLRVGVEADGSGGRIEESGRGGGIAGEKRRSEIAEAMSC